MRYTQAFIPTAKESPAEAQITSHQLMLRAGMIRQVAAGIYTWLPLGLKVLRNIENIIRTELDKAGLLELLMATLQPASLWQQSGRYDSYGKEMLRIKDRHDRDLLYGPTNEEVITDLFQQSLKSYRDVPQCWYQIQWKFRDEIRPRFGVMRGREFLMMDAYSFDLDYEGARATYEKIFLTYLKIFQKMGLKAIPVKADSGAIGGDLSHEFHVLADTGESGLFYDAAYDDLDVTTLTLDALQNIYAQTDDLHKPDACPVAADRLKERRGIEVGHIFYFADKYSTPLNALLTHKDGRKHPAHMGSYGIGVSRLVGAIIEAFHDDKGIIWPLAVAPYKVVVINLKHDDAACTQAAEKIYADLQGSGIETLLDDRDARIGAKLGDAELIGIPYQVIVGPKSLADDCVEFKTRANGTAENIALSDITAHLQPRCVVA